MGKSTPKPPDPAVVSAAQTQSNKDTAGYNAALNRIDQSSPFGSINYTSNGTDPTTGAPLYSQSTQLSPQLECLFNSQVGSQQGISDAVTGAIGRLPSQAFDPSGINTDAIAKASYDKQLAQLTPQFEQGARTLQGTLSDRGIPIGSEIWNNEQNRFDTQKNTSLDQASRQAQLDAGNEQSRQYGQALQNYNLPYQNLSALMGNSQAVGNPQFSGVPQANVAPTDTQGNTWAAYNAELQNAQNQNNNLFGGLLGLGKLGLGAYSAGMFSDRHVKQDIAQVGKLNDGQKVYRYRYVGDNVWHIGLIAQEVQEHVPEAVGEVGGVLTVNYDLATRKARKMAA